MKNSNICKFVSPRHSESLSATYFVREADLVTMRKEILLTTHRMFLITKSSGFLIYDNRKTPFAANQIVFAFKGEKVHIEPDEDCEYLYISFDGSRSDELFRRFNIHSANRVFSGFDSLVPMWKESLSRADTENIDLASESILYYTFSRLKPGNSPKNDLLHKVLDIVETQFNDFSLSLGSIALELSYNPKYISNLFKKEMKVGFSEYLRTVRIKYAITLFDHGLDSVKNVAFLSGFSDPLYFSTVFKNEMGLSPKEYINNPSKQIENSPTD